MTYFVIKYLFSGIDTINSDENWHFIVFALIF